MIIRNIIIGIGQGFQPVAGYNYGSGSKDRVRQAFWFSCAFGSAVCISAALGMYVTAPTLISLFRKDVTVIEIGTVALRFVCLALPFMAYSTFVNQMYQCLGFSTTASVLALCRQGIFFIPLILILPRMLGLTGIQSAQPLSDLLTLLVSVPLQIRFFRKQLA